MAAPVAVAQAAAIADPADPGPVATVADLRIAAAPAATVVAREAIVVETAAVPT